MARSNRASAMVALIDVACGSFGGLLLVSLVMIRVAPQPPPEAARGVITIAWYLANGTSAAEWCVQAGGDVITMAQDPTGIDSDLEPTQPRVWWNATVDGVPGFQLRVIVPELEQRFEVTIDTKEGNRIARSPRIVVNGTLVAKAVLEAWRRRGADLSCSPDCHTLVLTIDPRETDADKILACRCDEPVKAVGP